MDITAARELEYVQTQRFNHIGESGMRASLGLATMRQQRYRQLDVTAPKPADVPPDDAAQSNSLIGSHQDFATTAEASRDAPLLSSGPLSNPKSMRFEGIQKINEDQEYAAHMDQPAADENLVEDNN